MRYETVPHLNSIRRVSIRRQADIAELREIEVRYRQSRQQCLLVTAIIRSCLLHD